MNQEAHRQILVVDDNRNLTLALTIGLRRAGFEVAVAADGEEALVRLEQQRFDVVLTDVEMPSLSGVELAKQIEDRFPQTRLIIMSAYERPVSLEGYPFLAKPFDIDQLIGLLPHHESIDLSWAGKGSHVR
jgi:DNA-binding NtrC family response regulator